MRIDFLPASRSSIRWPTNSARQPRARIGGSSSSAPAEAEAIGDQIAHVGRRAGQARGHIRAAADAGQRGREKLPQQIELRRHRLAAAVRSISSSGASSPRRTQAASCSIMSASCRWCMPRIGLDLVR